MNIGFLIIGTNKYIDFAEQVSRQLSEKVQIEGSNITRFIFTNRAGLPQDSGEKRLHINHTPWPLPTLLRYHIFNQYYEYLDEMDYLYYIDADMRIDGVLDKSILGDLVGTLHPGFYNKSPYYYTFDDNPKSQAYIERTGGERYFAGGFNGGTTKQFMLMSNTISKWIDADLKQHYIALWHDESYLNRYFNKEKSPTLILSPTYCYPEEVNLPFERRITALKKSHENFRV